MQLCVAASCRSIVVIHPKCCHLVALQNNVPAELGGPGNQQVMHVQQQIIMRGDGVQLRIVRIVNVNPGSNQDISAQLAKILHDNFEAAEASEEGEDENIEEEGNIEDEEHKAKREKTVEQAKKSEAGNGKEKHEEDVDKLVKVMAAEGKNPAEQRMKIQASMQDVPPDHVVKSMGDPPRQGQEKQGKEQKTIDQAQPGLQNGKHGTDHQTGHHSDHKKLPEVEARTVVYHRESEIKVESGDSEKKDSRTPPPSMFQWLAPSRQRYTLLRDEL